MPNYLYNCTSCCQEFETILRIDDRRRPESEPCPSCSNEGTVNIQVVSPAIADAFKIGATQAPLDFRKHVLGRINDHHPNGNIGQKVNIPKE